MAGICYEAAALATFDKRYDTREAVCVLCHGYPRLTKQAGEYPPGTLYGHAWLEREDPVHGAVCIDAVTNTIVPKDVFYTVGRIDPEFVSVYQPVEVWDYLVLHRHYGPWENPPKEAKFAPKR